MERKQFLELCQSVSVLLGGGLIGDIPDNLVVVKNGIEYYPVEYSLSFDKDGRSIHKATLRDKKANSVCVCLLSEIHKKGEKNDSKT